MAAEQNRTQQIALLMKMLQDGLISEPEFKDLITKIGDQSTPAPAPAPEPEPAPLPPPSTTVPNIPAENSDNPDKYSLPSHEVPTSSVPQKLDKQKTTKIVLAAVALVLIALFAINKVQSSNRAEARKKAVDQQNQQNQKNSAEKERQRVMACVDKTNQIDAWTAYLAISNKHSDFTGVSLSTAQDWAQEESAAITDFIRETKDIQTNDVQTEKNVLISALKDLQEVGTLQITANSWSEFNNLVTRSNLANNLLNDAKDDLFDALFDACEATS